jgi:hypothetical protein
VDPSPLFTPLEWRMFASACEAVAAKERARAAECPDRANARDLRDSAETFDRLAERCMRLARGEANGNDR